MLAPDFGDNRSTPDVVPDEIVLSQGVREEGAVYTFNGSLAHSATSESTG